MASYRALITATTEALAGSNGSIALNNVKNTHKFFANGATKTEARAVLKEAPASEFYQTLGMGIGLGTVFGAAYLV